MKNLKILLGMFLIAPFQVAAQQSPTIGYFNEWPLPAQFGRENGAFSEALGIGVNWRAFNTGAGISAALSNDDIQIALSQGVVPLLLAINSGIDIRIVDIAVSYSGIENCVVRARLDITSANAIELEGLSVAVPLGTTVHFSLLEQLKHLGVNASKLHLLDMSPSRAAAAFAHGDADMACGWGADLEHMKERGNTLLNPEELSAIGILAFDAIVIQDFYGISNSETVANILNTNDKLNFAYRDDRSGMLDGIASAVSMTEPASTATLDMFEFPDMDEKLSEKWLGGGVQTYLKSLADFFVEQGTMSNALDSYDSFVSPEYLRAVQVLQLEETTNDPTVLSPQQQD